VDGWKRCSVIKAVARLDSAPGAPVDLTSEVIGKYIEQAYATKLQQRTVKSTGRKL